MTIKRITAQDRDETDHCEAGTPGCSVDHGAERDAGMTIDSCDTW